MLTYMDKHPILIDSHDPYKWQANVKPALNRSQRSCIVVARQHGKTELAIEDFLEFALSTNRLKPNMAIVGPTIEQCEKIYWDRLVARFSDKFYMTHVETKRTPSPKVVIARPYRQTMDNDKNIITSDTTIRFFGSEAGTAIEGQALDYVLCDEVGLWPIGVLKTSVEPALAAKKGIMRLYGTPRGDNDLYSSYISYHDFMQAGDEDYYSFLQNAYQLGVLTKEEVDKIRQDYVQQNKLHIFNMAYMCDFFANVTGSVFAKQIAESRANNKIIPVHAFPAQPICSVWDIGLSFTSCWVFQYYNNRYYLLNHFEWEDKSIEEFMPEFLGANYQFTRHYLPHDAYHRSRNDKKTYAQHFQDHIQSNGKVKKIPKIDREEERTQISRNLFHQCVFDADNCSRGLEKLAQYKLQTDNKTGYMKNKIVKDKYSHTGDAFCQMFMVPKLELQMVEFGGIMERMHIPQDHPMYQGKRTRSYQKGDVSKFGEMYVHKKRGF